MLVYIYCNKKGYVTNIFRHPYVEEKPLYSVYVCGNDAQYLVGIHISKFQIITDKKKELQYYREDFMKEIRNLETGYYWYLSYDKVGDRFEEPVELETDNLDNRILWYFGKEQEEILPDNIEIGDRLEKCVRQK